MGEVGEEAIAEGVVAEVLNGGAAIGVAAGDAELGFGETGVTSEQEGPDGLLPCEVDELFVALDGVGGGREGLKKQNQNCKRFQDSGANMHRFELLDVVAG